MNQSPEVHSLIIRNLSVLEDAPTVVAEVEKVVFRKIDQKIMDWVNSQGQWEGIFNFLEEETSFKPLEWEKDEEKNTYRAWYSFECEGGRNNDEYLYFISALLGVVPYRFGCWFGADSLWVTKISNKKGNNAWKSFLSEKYAASKLPQLGFELQGDRLFRPVEIKADFLADPESINDPLAPVDEALSKLKEAHPIINELLNAALVHKFDG